MKGAGQAQVGLGPRRPQRHSPFSPDGERAAYAPSFFGGSTTRKGQFAQRPRFGAARRPHQKKGLRRAGSSEQRNLAHGSSPPHSSITIRSTPAAMPPMRRRARTGTRGTSPPETFLDIRPWPEPPTISNAFTIVSGLVIADRSGGDFIAVADQIVLERLDGERVLPPSSASIPPCGIEKGLWLKSTFFLVLVIFVEREIHDPCQRKGVFVDQAEFLRPHGCARRPPAWQPSAALPAAKNSPSFLAKAKLGVKFGHAVWPVVLGDRPRRIPRPCG